MGPTKIMIIRHAEKPGIYNKVLYNGINGVGQQDPASLVTMGWERAGGIANLFYPTNGNFQSAALITPSYVYASNPVPQPPINYKTEPSGNMVEDETSQRPYQTISALNAKMKFYAPVNTSFVASDYANMVTHLLAMDSAASYLPVLIAWQHQDILPQPNLTSPIANSIMTELLNQTRTTDLKNIPTGPWPADRYDIVFVLNRPSGTGPFTAFTQVPQMLLAGDSSINI